MGTLHGTLLIPPGRTRSPGVLILPGSGPTDRDGNTRGLPGKNNSLLLLAEALGARGIASLRIDKRGIGASTEAGPIESDLRLESFVDDAVAWTDRLLADPRLGPIMVLGHSEGALIGALAAGQRPVSGYIGLAAPGRRASDLLRRQLEGKLPDSLARESERILTALEQGEQADSVPSELLALYRPSVQPYHISWFRQVPVETVARLHMPVLLAYGSADLQVPGNEAELFRARRPDVHIVKVPGMNHVLKLVSGPPTAQIASYSDPALPVAPALLDAVAAFIGVNPA